MPYYINMKKYYKEVDAVIDANGNESGPSDIGVPLWYCTDWKTMTDEALNTVANSLIPFGLTMYVVDVGGSDYFMWGISNA